MLSQYQPQSHEEPDWQEELPSWSISVPQRRASTNDKNRLRWVDAKLMALSAVDCGDTKEVRKWLDQLGVGSRLNLRMTSAWVSVRVDLKTAIKEMKRREKTSNIVRMEDYRKEGEDELSESSVSPDSPPPDSSPPTAGDFKVFNFPEPGSEVDKLYQGMIDAIRFSNLDLYNRALVGREDCFAAAWDLLMFGEQQYLEHLKTQQGAIFESLIAAPCCPLPTTKTDVEIVYEAMLDAIDRKNWEFARRALVGREQCKDEVCKLLSKAQLKQINALAPAELKYLKAAKKAGKIFDFNEVEEGGLFLIWETQDSEPNILSGTQVYNSYAIFYRNKQLSSSG